MTSLPQGIYERDGWISTHSDIGHFEDVVFSQKPAETPWTPVLPYDIETRREVEGIQPKLIKDIFKPSNALDFGAGAGFLVAFLCELGVNVRGYEPDKTLRELAPNHIRWNMSDSYWDNSMNGQSGRGYYDLVICREVLEHLTLREGKDVLRKLCMLSSRYVYITTRFSSEHDLLRVETSDDLDPTHINLPAKDLYRLLLTLEGFKRRADLEDRMDWKHLNRCLVYERA